MEECQNLEGIAPLEAQTASSMLAWSAYSASMAFNYFMEMGLRVKFWEAWTGWLVELNARAPGAGPWSVGLKVWLWWRV